LKRMDTKTSWHWNKIDPLHIVSQHFKAGFLLRFFILFSTSLCFSL
jgi:hypothetical protein